MTGIDLFSTQQEILAYVQASIPQFVVESGGIPTAESLPFVDGVLEPYIVLRFSDDMPTSGGGSFMGAAYDEYYSYVDALCVGQSDTDARELANLVKTYLLGKKFENSAPLKKNYGGGQFAIFSEASRQPLAFIAVSSYRFGTNMTDVGSGTNV